MTTRQQKALTDVGNHEVGNLCSMKIKTVNYGAIVDTADIDNFTLVELDFNDDGERICKQLSDATKKSYLIASPEERNMGEALVDFYNAVGDRARIVVLEPAYTRFDTSAFELNTDGDTNGGTAITEILAGQVAHFNPATKKFMISDATSPATDYATAKAKFTVVFNEDDLDFTCGKAMVRLECAEA